MTPILIRECSNINPTLWTRYDFGIEKQIPLTGMNAEQVFNAVENLTSKTLPASSDRIKQ
jgi:NADH dehydrogenase (ubiquinone) 1 alpha subcomplex subunit 2